MATATDLSAADLAWAAQVARSVERRLALLWDIEDLEQVARIAVWQARKFYDPSRNDNFRLYALPYVRGAVLMLVRREYRDKHHLPMESSVAAGAWGAGRDVNPDQQGSARQDDAPMLRSMAEEPPPMEEWIDGSREAAELRRAIARLPRDQRRPGNLAWAAGSRTGSRIRRSNRSAGSYADDSTGRGRLGCSCAMVRGDKNQEQGRRLGPDVADARPGRGLRQPPRHLR